MSTTLARKAWRDLGRRRARTMLTSATIALAVAGMGLLAVPTLIDRTMSAEVRDTQLYDITLPVRDLDLDDEARQELAAIPNVDAISARATYSTRALVGDRRIPAMLLGVEDFARQPIDVVGVTSGAIPTDAQVLADDGNAAAVDVGLAAGEPVRLIAADGSTAVLEVSGEAHSLAFWQGPWQHPKQLVLYAPNDTVRALSGASGVNSLAVRLIDTDPDKVDATVERLQAWLDANVGAGALSDLPVTRDEGDWPGREFAHQMTTFVYVLAGLALITAVFLIATTMNTLMAEQTAEIGVMKAIGGRRRQIAGVYLRSALYLAGFGVVVGVPIGIALAHFIAGFVTSSVLGVPGRFAVSIPVVAFSAAFAVVLTVGASAPALRRALRIPVREGLQKQGAAVTFGTSPIDRLLLHSRLLPRTIRLGARNLVRNKRRTAATVFQISLAVATALGFLNMAISFGRELDKDFAIIDWDASMYAPAGAPALDAAAIEIAAGTDGVERVEPVLANTIEYADETYPVYGMTDTPLYQLELRAGRWFTDDEARLGLPVAVVGPNTARVNGLEPGDTITVTTSGGKSDVRIVGVDRNQQDSGRAIYVPLRWLQDTTGWGESTNMLWLSMTSTDDRGIDRTTNAVEDALTADGYRVAPEKLYALKADNEAANDAILNMITMVGGVVVAIGMVGLVNSITMNVIERTREIGILRCIGARARDIRRAFAAESALQAVLGWVLGLPLGFLLSWGLARLTLTIMELEIATVFDTGTALIVLAATVTLATLIVIGPTRRATRVNAGDALRYV
ncbi:MAG TPA: FtsX-like permease family protein [Ilumatobacteraceae bacterium]|nr:FtsX-like permease family protein [Ilumatobacteraceae bacterium]